MSHWKGVSAAPTWKLCHPVNIYVYKNGVTGEKPQLVHIPMEKKKNMATALEEIGTRMKLPVGYPVALYNMDGTRICKTYELEMYNNYVVVTNMEKRFKCVDYGRVREPLVVIGPYSKHIRTLQYENKPYDFFCRRKMAQKPLHELITMDKDGLGPEDIDSGKPCGELCHKLKPTKPRLCQCYSDEVMVVEGAAMEVEPDICRQRQREDQATCAQLLTTPDTQEIGLGAHQFMADATFPLEGTARGSCDPLVAAQHLADLMQRYKLAGSDIFKMFQDKINNGRAAVDDSHISSRWNIPTNLSSDTQQRLKDELERFAEQQATCDFSFDEFGNFVFKDSGCPIGQGANLSTQLSPESLDRLKGFAYGGCDIFPNYLSDEEEGPSPPPSSPFPPPILPPTPESQTPPPQLFNGDVLVPGSVSRASKASVRSGGGVETVQMMVEVDVENNLSKRISSIEDADEYLEEEYAKEMLGQTKSRSTPELTSPPVSGQQAPQPEQPVEVIKLPSLSASVPVSPEGVIESIPEEMIDYGRPPSEAEMRDILEKMASLVVHQEQAAQEEEEKNSQFDTEDEWVDEDE